MNNLFGQIKAPSLQGKLVYICLLSSVVAATACGVKASVVNSRNMMSQPQSTTIDATEGNLVVRLTSQDSERLSKVFSKVVIQPTDKPPAPDVATTFNSSTEDLKIDCLSSAASQASKVCTVSIRRKPAASENSLESDESTGEHMFHLRKLIDVKRLYSALNVKEWDLQGSTYKRFSSSDNKLILECILDDERSRCSVFLSNGQSDDFSD
jgi:hypothetical protein